MRKFSFCFCSALFATTSALAMTCLNDYSGNGKGCARITEAAGDCATLGYSTNEVSGCKRYLYCPFDTDYKRCVTKDENSSACNEVSEFSVCQTVDSCEKDLNNKCYHCKDGFEYKTGMTGWKQIISENIRPMIFAVKPKLASGTWTPANGITGCQCIARYGCSKTEFPYVITSGVLTLKEDTCEYKEENGQYVLVDPNCNPNTACPVLAECHNTCTDTCGGTYGQITGCVENAEMVDGKCQCKTGFYEEDGKCITCSEEYNKLNNISKYRYWLSVKSGGSLDYAYTMLGQTVLQPGSSGGLSITEDPNYNGSGNSSDDVYFGNDQNCQGLKESSAKNCCSVAKQMEKRINKYNTHCPSTPVSMPSINCGSVCTDHGGNHSSCFGNICSQF